MALTDFLTGVRLAAGFLDPQVTVIPDDTHESASLTDGYKRAAIWLTPQAVNRFDPTDFIAMPLDQRSALEDAVRAFRNVAERVGPTGPISGEDYKEGLDAFGKMLNILDPYLFDPEGRRILSAVWSVRSNHREFILGFDFMLTSDPSGDPAVIIWIVVPDDAAFGTQGFRDRINAIRQDVFVQLENKKINRYPYIRIRAKSEVWEEVEVDAA